MQRSLRQLLVYSVILLFINSCKTYSLPTATEIKTEKSIFENPYFLSYEDLLYRCKINIYNNELTGVLIIKQTSENHYRIALTTDFGNKLLDFECGENLFKINYITPEMDRDIVKKFLKKDFSLLLKSKFPIKSTFSRENENIYLSQEEKIQYYWFINNESSLPKEMVFVENGREKINFLYETNSSIFVDKLTILHKDYKIKFDLTRIID